MTTSIRKTMAPQAGALGLDDLREAAPIRATEKMPAEIAELLRPDSGIYIRSETKPSMDFGLEQVRGSEHMWRVVDNATRGRLRTTVPGREQRQVKPGEGLTRKSFAGVATRHYRPPWLDQEFLPRLAPFRLAGWDTGLPRARVLRPRAQEAERLTYPWCTVGRVVVESSSGSKSASGVLVGPNLVLTAAHVAPWGAANWSMEFIPAYRRDDSHPRPLGSSFVERIRGYHTEGDLTGYDYVVCKLYRPLGDALGWMGTQSWGDGFAMGIRDSDSDSHSGIGRGVGGGIGGDNHNDDDGTDMDLEAADYASPVSSGGPQWFFADIGPLVVGAVGGTRGDGLDSRRHVDAGYHSMVELVKYGLDNWRP